MTPDFSLLYSQLDLPPDCSLEEFRSAYVRRIAQLHPDRTGSKPLSADAQATLRELVSTYVAVTRFHRRYGRMPGGSPYAGMGSNPMMTAMRPALQVRVAVQHPTVSGRHHALRGGAGAQNPMLTSIRPALQVPVISTAQEAPRNSRATLRLVLIIFTLGLLLAGWDISGLPVP